MRALLGLLWLPLSLLGQSPVWLHTEGGWQATERAYLRAGEPFALAIPTGQQLLRCYPTEGSYANLPEPARIQYRCERVALGPDTLRGRFRAWGTQHLGLWPIEQPLPERWPQPPPTQLHIRRDDGYLGYLTELIGVPFVLPPRRLPDGRHQTDLGLGVDCAELAIYGRRRLGQPVPYVGPRGIYDYLRPIPRDSLFEGCVLHFGAQVSVLFADRGRPGRLDPEDVLIQSYEDWVKTLPWRDSGWYRREWQAFAWRE